MRAPQFSIVLGALALLLGAGGAWLLAMVAAPRISIGRSVFTSDPWLFAFLSGIGLVTVLLAWFGIDLLRNAIAALNAERRACDAGAFERRNAPRPWLRHAAWRRRRIPVESPLRDDLLALSFVFFGLPCLHFLWVGFVGTRLAGGRPVGPLERIEYLVVGGVLAAVLAGLGWWRLRRARHGAGRCTLITLPGVAGGWLKADVEGALPSGAEGRVTVRLRNLESRGGRTVELWRHEETLQLADAGPGARSVVPVRLRIARDEKQRPMAQENGAGWLDAQPVWMLDVEKRAGGTDFRASFHVPVYDTTDAPVHEQADDGK